MPYVQQPWTDNLTPVDAAHMTHIEAGIAAVEVVALSPKTTRSAITAPPVSPSDGDLWFAGSVPSGYTWSFRWNAGSAFWEFTGGNPSVNYNTTPHPGTSAWLPLISFTVSRAGVYAIAGSVMGSFDAAGGSLQIGVGTNGAVAIALGAVSGSPYQPVSCSSMQVFQNCAAGDTLSVFGWLNAAGMTNPRNVINVWPVAIT
jgi:hypothetical protein